MTTNINYGYPYTEWQIIEESFDINNNFKNESLFSLGNGFLGMRGTFEENYAGPEWPGLEGTYINGFYETEKIQYGESAYAFPEYGQTMLNVSNGKIIKLYLEDEEFSMSEGKVTNYKRELNMREGLLRRSLEWQSPKGRKVRLTITRLVSFTESHLAAIHYALVPLNFSGIVKLVSALDGDVANLTTEKDPRVGSGLRGRVLETETAVSEGGFGALIQKTRHSRLKLVCAMENQLFSEGPFTVRNHSGNLSVETVYTVNAKQNEEITLSKYIAYHTSADFDNDTELLASAKSTVIAAKNIGFVNIMNAQKQYMADFWERSDISVKGDPAIQQGIRFNIFHLLQSAGKDGKTSIAAKGLSGEGYEGHYFWDSEMYVLPFFLYNNPEISRKMLEYRYHTLDKARERARQMSHPKGALFPWRTINGEECSAYFPAGTAQYHINADIAFAVKRYVQATDDFEFLRRYGAEILFETARLWADLGDYIPKKGNRFCINAVTGPDEYTAVVNNNFYTNLMAKENLDYAWRVARWMMKEYLKDYSAIAQKIGLETEEAEGWKKAADNMYLPYDEELGIYAQDDSFLEKAVWDFKGSSGKKPLLLHYHPLVIYRYQVCKQADVLLALHLLGDRFNTEEIKRNFDYYEKVTTHDSSLSNCVFGMVAVASGYYERAYHYFLKTARMDLDDHHGNVNAGVHIANMAGTGLGIVNGFAGIRVIGDTLCFKPHLPEAWQEYRFRITFKGRLIQVTVDREGAKYALLEGGGIIIRHNDEEISLTVAI